MPQFLSKTARITSMFLMLFFVTTKVRANDSDVVNCNHAWKIVVLGSSTSYGTGATVYDSSWVGKFTAYIKRKNANSEIINLAVPGFNTYQNLRPDGYIPPVGRPTTVMGNNITTALNAHPDAIIINMPSNDATNLFTLAEQQDNFEATLHLADSANVPVWVTTSQPRNNMSAEQISLLEGFRDWVLTRFGTKAVNFWQDLANPDGSIADVYDYDNVHVNNGGHNIFYTRIIADHILDTLCTRYSGTLTASAGNDTSIVLASSAFVVNVNASSSVGIITGYTWNRISGPLTYQITNNNTSVANFTSLSEGRYSFEVVVTDDRSNIAKDTINITVSSRILFDFGATTTASPDANGKYWNNITSGTNGIKLQNAVTVANTSTSIGLEIINRIDGTFNLAGPGVNTGNTVGAVSDYPNSATTDYAFAEPSATNGSWKITGLDILKEYSIKFWGAKSNATDSRVIEIKRADETTWKSYNALNNSDFNNAAIFVFSGKSEMNFDIRVQAGSTFGHIGLIDISRTTPADAGNLPPVSNAGNDVTLTLPTNTVQLDGSASSDEDGTIASYQWRKISGSPNYNISSTNTAITSISALTEGNYKFELKVTDDQGATDLDTVTVIVGTRILIDFGPTTTAAPDANGKYWNNVISATPGIKLSNAVTTNNLNTTIGLEVVNRIDGTFNIAGAGVNTGNTIGDVSEYPNSATTDYAFADPSATNGRWKITGLDSLKTYTIKFWGARTAADARVIEIKQTDDITWKSYNGANNSNYNTAASFTFTGKKEVSFDIRVQAGSSFGYIGVIDIIRSTNANVVNLTPNAIAGNDINLILPANSTTLNGSNSTDDDGYIASYQWTKIAGPDQITIASPNSATSAISNLAQGTYQFQLKVTDDQGAIDYDTIIVSVGARILFDFGSTLTTGPDANGNYWNNVTTANAGVKTVNAVSTGNVNTGISFEVVNRIDGTFNTAGPGVNTGNTIGVVNDYPNSVTTDYAFGHPTATNGSWKISGLDAAKIYTVKFWGTRNALDTRVIEIKRADETTWLSYDALNNSDYNRAAVFTITGKTEMSFDIRVPATSSFGHISLIDINYTTPLITCLPTTSTTNITACNSYLWNGITHTQSGTFTFSTLKADGCDSTATLNLTINQSTTSSTSITACNTYNWNGTDYTVSGSYPFTTTNANNCDSVATLILTINHSSTSSTSITACDTYNWNGTDYTVSGSYPFTTTNASGCDSVATLILIINHSSTSSTRITACNSYRWNGTDYTVSGSYPFTTTNASGCDSVATLILTIYLSTSTSSVVSTCDNYTWNDSTYYISGIYTFTSTNPNGCALVSTLNLTIKNSTSSSIDITECNSYLWNGTTYTESGMYSFSTNNASGCDSTATLNLTINNSTTSSTDITSCNSYLWNGTTYTASGVYTHISTNANNCILTATLNLTITHPTSSLSNIISCSAYLWNGITYTQTGVYTYPTTNAAGCDSIATLNLSIGVLSSSITNIKKCSSYTWNGTTYTTSGTYTYSTSNTTGCDSTATLNLIIIPLPFSAGAITGPTNACNYEGSNGYTAVYTINAVNADSIVWDIPEDATMISGEGTNSISINYSTAFASGVISVTVYSPCGSPITRTLAITRRTPSTPSPIIGVTQVCSYFGTGQLVTYSVTPVLNAISYRWLLPTTITLVSANQDSSSINVLINNTFNSTLNKIIKAQAVAYCGVSGYASLSLSATIPSIPGAISGPTLACSFIGSNNIATYKINKVANANSYNWVVPTGSTIVSHPGGLGINDTILNVTFDNSFVSGTSIKVNVVSACGSGSARSLAITKNVPTSPYAITGPSNICAYIASANAATYLVRKDVNATSYNWTVPAGTTITHLNGLGANDTIVEVLFPSNFTTGAITITTENGCGTSSVTTLNLTYGPLNTPTLTGPADACQYVDIAAVYTIRKISGAINYTWVIPSNVTFVNHLNPPGANDTIIELAYASTFIRGSISVSANSECSSSAVRSIAIGRKVASLPNAIVTTTLSSSCPNRRYSYSISATPTNASGIAWSVPTGSVIDSGQGTLKIYVSYPTSAIVSQYVSVAGINGCGLGSPRTIIINIAACVTPLTGNNNTNIVTRNNTFTVNENNFDITVNAMPNPTQSEFNISFTSKDLITPLSISIFDMNGRMVKAGKNIIPGQKITIGSELIKGIYIGEFIQGKNRKTIKLIKM